MLFNLFYQQCVVVQFDLVSCFILVIDYLFVCGFDLNMVFFSGFVVFVLILQCLQDFFFLLDGQCILLLFSLSQLIMLLFSVMVQVVGGGGDFVQSFFVCQWGVIILIFYCLMFDSLFYGVFLLMQNCGDILVLFNDLCSFIVNWSVYLGCWLMFLFGVCYISFMGIMGYCENVLIVNLVQQFQLCMNCFMGLVVSCFN